MCIFQRVCLYVCVWICVNSYESVCRNGRERLIMCMVVTESLFGMRMCVCGENPCLCVSSYSDVFEYKHCIHSYMRLPSSSLVIRLYLQVSGDYSDNLEIPHQPSFVRILNWNNFFLLLNSFNRSKKVFFKKRHID